jgi:hypothetical protein
MYTAKNTMNKILDTFPDFKGRYEKHVNEWDDTTGLRTIHSDIDTFFDYISDKLENNENYDYQLTFSIVEELLVNGDEEVSNAIAMMFLESLLNHSSHGDFPIDSFFNYLGKESKAFCKANEEFWGIENSKFYEDK